MFAKVTSVPGPCLLTLCLLTLCLLTLGMSAVTMQTAAAAEPLPPASHWIPQQAILVVQLDRPDALLDLAFDQKLGKAVTSLPAFRQLQSRPQYKQFLGVVAFLEARLGTDWQTGIRKLIGGGVTFAVGPGDSVLLIVDAKDAEMLNELHETLLGFAKGDQSQTVTSREHQGVKVWSIGGNGAHAIVGNRLVASNKPAVLEAALKLRASSGGGNLASLPGYRAAEQAAGRDAVATVFVNMQVLKQLPPVQQALAGSENPLAALMFAGVMQSLQESSYLAMGLQVEGKTLKLTAAVDGKAADPSGPAAFALPGKPELGALDNLPVPRRIAALSFYRDLHAFYAAKDDLFPERTSGLIFFENMMGIFFSGMDLTEEVLGELQPEMRFVVAEQAYDPAVGTPAVQMPAFAAIFRMHHPEQFAEVMEEAWQKAIGLANFTRGQQAQPGLIIDRPTHGDTTFTVAYFRAPQDDARTDIDARFNFRPALAGVGDYLVLSSTEGLAKDLIGALNKETAGPLKPLAQTHSLVEMDVVQLASILGANRQNLVRQNMLEEGSTKQQAEAQTDLLLTVLGYLGRAKIELASRDGRPQAELQLQLNVP